MGYNKRQFQKTNDKKVLHKVRKHWVVVSLAMLMAIGGGALATHTASANADATNANNGNNVNNTQSIKESLNSKLQSNQANVNSNQNNNQANANQNNQKVNSNAIQQQAEALHNEILGNAAQHQASSNNISAQQQPSAQGRQATPQVNNNGVKANVPSHNGFGAVKLANPNNANLNNKNQVTVDQNSDKQSANAPKRLLGGSSNISNGDSDSSIVNNSNPKLSTVWMRYFDVTNGEANAREIFQNFQSGPAQNPNHQFAISANRTGAVPGYYFVNVKGAQNNPDFPGVNLNTVNGIEFPPLGKEAIINFEVKQAPETSKKTGTILYIYQDASDGDRQVNMRYTKNYATSNIPNAQSFLTPPTNYKFQSATGYGVSKNGNNYNLPTTIPVGEQKVFINVVPIAKPMTSADIEYVDEGNGQIVGDELASGQRGKSVSDLQTNYEAFTPSGYTYDANNAANTALNTSFNNGKVTYTPGSIYYVNVKKNTPDDTSNGYVNIIFKNANTGKVVDQHVLSGPVNSPVDVSQGTVSSMLPSYYRYSSADSNNQPVSQYTHNLQNLVYYVEYDGGMPVEAKENVKYVDYQHPSTQYGSDETITGKPNSLINWHQYTSVLPANTEFVKLGNHDSRLVDGKTSTVYVKHVSTNAKPITIKYINQLGQNVGQSTVNGAFGTNYSDITKAPGTSVPQGYSLNDNSDKPIKQNLSYTVGSDAQTVNVLVNGIQYTVPLTIHRTLNGKKISDKTFNVTAQAGNSTPINVSDYNPNKTIAKATSNNATVTMSSQKNPRNSNNIEGVLSQNPITFNYVKSNYNTPNYNPQNTQSDNGSRSDYTSPSTKSYPSDNTNDPFTKNGNKVPTGYIPAWVPSDATKPNGKHTNGYVPSDHVPQGYVPGLVPNGQGSYVPGYVDPNHLPTGSNNNGKVVPKYVAGTVPNGNGGQTSGLVPAGSITVHYVNASDNSHINSDVVNGHPSDNFDISNYVDNVPSGYAVKSVDYGTNNYSNAGTKITKFDGNNQDVNVMVDKLATATLDYVDKNGNTYPGMSKTLSGISGTQLNSSDYEDYLPLGYSLDKNQPSIASNNNWKLANNATYKIRVNNANVTSNQAKNSNGYIVVDYKDAAHGDPNYNKIVGAITVAAPKKTSFAPDMGQYDGEAPAGYSSMGFFERAGEVSDMTFSSDLQHATVDVQANSTPAASTSSELINYINADNNHQIASRRVSGKTGAPIDWSPYEEYLPSNTGTYWAFNSLGTHNVNYGDGGTSTIYLSKAKRVHKNATPNYDPDSTRQTNSDYFPSDNNPYQSDAPSDVDLANGRSVANDGNVNGGKLPSNYVPGWIPADPSKPNGAHKAGYIPSDDIPDGFVPGQVPNGKGGYVPGYVPSDASLQPSGTTNGTKSVPTYVSGTVSDGSGHKVPGMVPSNNSLITIHYIDADHNNSDVSDVSLSGRLDQSFNVAQYQKNLPQGYSYIQTNYGKNNFNNSGTNNGTPVTEYDGNSHDINIMLHRTDSATVNYIDNNGTVVATKKLTGEAGSGINSADYTTFIPYGYSLTSDGPATTGTWRYDNTSDTVHLTNNSDAATTPSDNSKTKNYGYVNVVFKDKATGNIVGSYATAQPVGTSYGDTAGNTVSGLVPAGYTSSDNHVDPTYINWTYKAGKPQSDVVLVSKTGNVPSTRTETIKYIDADNNQLIASDTTTGKTGTPIDYSKLTSNLPSADGGNWAYDFMGPHSNTYYGGVDTIYIHKAQPAQQFGLINIKYVDASDTNRVVGENPIQGVTGSPFDITKYENDIPNNGTTQSDMWTFNHAVGAPNFFGNDDVHGKTMTVYVNAPTTPVSFGQVTVNYQYPDGTAASTPVTVTGNVGDIFDPSSFEDNIPSGTSFTSVSNPVYNFSATPQTMTINVSSND